MRYIFRTGGIAAALLLLSIACGSQQRGWPNAIKVAADLAPEARIIVLDVPTGKLVATQRLEEAGRTLAAPGSTLKPLVLYSVMAADQWHPERRVSCNRQLEIAGRRLECTHPFAPAYDAREALTWSCNSYFAEVARTIVPCELGTMLSRTGILRVTGLVREEVVAEFQEPASVKETQLAVLEVEHVRVSPLKLATAYRWLALELAAHPDSAAAQVVHAGLKDSASFGMAGQVSLGGASVTGKTGTAEGAISSQTHGWFAGMAPAENPRLVVVVYLPAGRGADAARVAGELFAHASLERQ